MMIMKIMMMLILSLYCLYDLETSAYYPSPDEYHKKIFYCKTFWTMLQDYRVFSYKKHIYKKNELKSDQD